MERNTDVLLRRLLEDNKRILEDNKKMFCEIREIKKIVSHHITIQDRKYKEMRVKEWLRHCPRKIEAEPKRKANLHQMENSNEEDDETAETDSD